MVTAVIVIVVVAVLAFGLLGFWLMRRSQKEVPTAADAAAGRPRVVATDGQGRPVTDAEEAPEPPRDTGAFEDLLQDEIHDRGMQRPDAGDQP